MVSIITWWSLAIVVAVVAFLCTNNRHKWFYIIVKTYRRDFRLFTRLIRLRIKLRLALLRNKTVASVFTALAKKHPQKAAFLFEDETWTYAQAEDFTNQVARYFKSQGFKKGDCVALILENRPEYPCLWIGLSKIGVVTALINTKLFSDSLFYSIKVANCKAVIFGSNHVEAIKDLREKLESLRLYQFHEVADKAKEVLPNCTDLKEKLKNVSKGPVDVEVPLGAQDPLIYMFTSGTTGLPKPAIISNIRYMFGGWCVYVVGKFNSRDILYTPLPFYHGGGGMLGLGVSILAGSTVAIRKKFSASNYWKDCAKYKCTAAQYIGEMCRYLLAVQEEPVKHCVKKICGNGLRPQIWKEFVQKFDVKEVYEYYGSTEGVANLMNMDSTEGSVGFVPIYAQFIYPVILIKCNMDDGEPIRDGNGRCIECKANEAGLLVAKINRDQPIFTFHGYLNKEATDKKILLNVFRDGDSYFNSGDVLIRDELGNYYFKDRMGDTFRWKGENVSTSEVEAVISKFLQFNDAIVFGVEVPGAEGKAGMVAIVDNNKTFDLDVISRILKNNFPLYVIPLFLRVMESVPLTGTYKLKKIKLQSEGYNINKIKDKVYFYDTKVGKYVPLTKDLHEQILNGSLSI